MRHQETSAPVRALAMGRGPLWILSKPVRGAILGAFSRHGVKAESFVLRFAGVRVNGLRVRWLDPLVNRLTILLTLARSAVLIFALSLRHRGRGPVPAGASLLLRPNADKPVVDPPHQISLRSLSYG
jgi:hypothetical protein